MKDQIEKQAIEEMAKDIFESGVAIDGIDRAFAAVHGADMTDSHFMRIAQYLYNAGYRKQSEIIDEFAERIKKHFTQYPEPSTWLEIPEDEFCEGIDELVAEMKGGE